MAFKPIVLSFPRRNGRSAPARDFFESVVVNYDRDDCLIWPFARDQKGYGLLFCDGRMQNAHRLACAYRHGLPSDPELQAAHSCHNGHLGCVNPRHLRWATVRENADDRSRSQRAGAAVGTPKLRHEDVRAIRKDPRSAAAIAVDYNVSAETIRALLRGESYRFVPLEELPLEEVPGLSDAIVVRLVRNVSGQVGRRSGFTYSVSLVCTPDSRPRLERAAREILRTAQPPRSLRK